MTLAEEFRSRNFSMYFLYLPTGPAGERANSCLDQVSTVNGVYPPHVKMILNALIVSLESTGLQQRLANS